MLHHRPFASLLAQGFQNPRIVAARGNDECIRQGVAAEINQYVGKTGTAFKARQGFISRNELYATNIGTRLQALLHGRNLGRNGIKSQKNTDLRIAG